MLHHISIQRGISFDKRMIFGHNLPTIPVSTNECYIYKCYIRNWNIAFNAGAVVDVKYESEWDIKKAQCTKSTNYKMIAPTGYHGLRLIRSIMEPAPKRSRLRGHTKDCYHVLCHSAIGPCWPRQQASIELCHECPLNEGEWRTFLL